MLLIAAMMMAPIAAILSTSTISAAHTLEQPLITDDLAVAPVENIVVKGAPTGTTYTKVFYITVPNASGSANDIRRVKLIMPTATEAFDDPDVLKKILKDNIVRLAEADNLVVLPAGTVVVLEDNDNLLLPAGTDVIIEDKPTDRVWYGDEDYPLLEDGWAEVRVDTLTEYILTATENENIAVAHEVIIPIADDNRLRLIADTPVIDIGGGLYRLPENTLFELVAPNDNNLSEDNRIYFLENIKVTLKDNKLKAVADILLSPSPLKIVAGENFELLNADLEVILPPLSYDGERQVVQLVGTPLVSIPENENVLVVADDDLNTTAAGTSVTIENYPKNWATGEGTEFALWENIGASEIAPGENLVFPVALKVPAEGGSYTFKIETTDDVGGEDWDTVVITVDNTAPTLTVTVDKSWVGSNETVTITVSGNEPFSVENLLVWENNGVENAVSLLSTENFATEYVVQYTTHENAVWNNENRDGYMAIGIIYSDEVGNKGTDNFNEKVFIDRLAPDPPSLTGLGFPPAWSDVLFENAENKTSWTISPATGYDVGGDDDNLLFVPPGYSPEGVKLQVFKDNAWVDAATADAWGDFSYTLTLSDGKQEIGARYVDKAGNVGAESLENVVVDTVKPSVSVSISPALTDGYLAENKFTITVTFGDVTLGIDNLVNQDMLENKELDNGYVVALCDKDGNLITLLTPKVEPTEDNVENVRPGVFGVAQAYTFENYYDNAGRGLATGKYWIRAIAGDNMKIGYDKGAHQTEDNISFELDIVPPSAPEIAVTAYVGTTVDAPHKTRTKTWALRGGAGAAEAGATIRIYGTTYDPITYALVETDILLGEVTVAEDGSYSVTVDLEAHEGKVVELELEPVDVAGNVGSRTLFGNFLFDDNPPIVSIDTAYKDITTTEESVVIMGSVSKDDWETFPDLIVTVSPATAAISFRPDGTFTVSAPAPIGESIVSVTATDPIGNSSSDYATITREKVVEPPPPPYAAYAIVIVIIALILAAIAIFRKR
jgi:hypothetical protein